MRGRGNWWLGKAERKDAKVRKDRKGRQELMDFLFEVGLEEVPARMIAGAMDELVRRVSGLLERERLVLGQAAVRGYSTPRRLAVVVTGVMAQQEDLREEVMGPAAKIAYKDGVAGPAAVAFCEEEWGGGGGFEGGGNGEGGSIFRRFR